MGIYKTFFSSLIIFVTYNIHMREKALMSFYIYLYNGPIQLSDNLTEPLNFYLWDATENEIFNLKPPGKF